MGKPGKLKTLIFVIAVIVAACTTVEKKGDATDELERMVWPPKPAEAKIAYVQAFSTAEELGIGKNFWQWLGHFFMGADDVRIVKPMAVVVSPKGEMFVADPGSQGVHCFDRRRNKHRLIQGKDNMGLPSPVGMVIDKEGKVIVSDSSLDKLFRFNSCDGPAIAVALETDLKQPTGLAIDPQTGNLFVVETAMHRVSVFNEKGELINRFGHRGSAAGEFNYPTLIWRDEGGRLLVTDSLNFRVQIFDSGGHFQGKFGAPGDATGYQARPKGVATDNDGHIYIVDSLFHTVQVFDRAGRFLLNFGAVGHALGHFWLPTGIFVDDQQMIYVADSHNQRVQIFQYIGVEQ